MLKRIVKLFKWLIREFPKVRMSRLQVLTTKYENLKMLEDENIYEYNVRLCDIVNNSFALGEKCQKRRTDMKTRSAARIDNNDHSEDFETTEEEDLNDRTGSVSTEEEEDEIADMRNKKSKKTSSRILHRCFPKKLTELVLLLNEGKKDPSKKEDCIKKEKYIKECGFGGLLKPNITIIPGVFVSWILNNFDKDRGMVVNENARITVGEEDVKRVYDLPRVKKIIDLEKVDKSNKEKLNKFKEQLGYIGETYDSMINIHTNVLYERLMKFEITKNKAWAKGFILLAIETILCPTTSYLVHFLDMVQTTKKKKIVEKPPSCSKWEDDIVSLELKKIKEKGGFNKVIVLNKKDCDVPESSRAEKDMEDEVMHDKIAETAKHSREKVIQRKGKKRKTHNVDDEMMEAHLASHDYALEEYSVLQFESTCLICGYTCLV
ncbi:uncharacterized protein LOC131614504 [Vicia villosa]|uniref:uncharacterized protein LOC131614504 n=1 Tax=Vicia villosa TaxID=3911 RepID=UPI00273C9492|nr:uncharacterized protein LOC131614504 [Vicia villosa]